VSFRVNEGLGGIDMRINNPYYKYLRKLVPERVKGLVLRLTRKSRISKFVLRFTSLQILEISKFMVPINRDINPSSN
jgi:hypothetical protein